MNDPAGLPKAMLPKAILFDLDDTIISAHGGQGDAWRQVLGGFADHDAIDDHNHLHDRVVASAQWFWSDPDRHRVGRHDIRQARRDIVSRAFAEIALSHDDLAHTIADAFSDHREQAMNLFPGAIETLDRLRDLDVGMALVTNGGAQGQRAKIERFDLTHRFDHILIEGEFGAGKPDASVFLHLMECLDSTPETTWVVGDNLEWEVIAPQRLGIHAIWCDAYGKGLPEGSDVKPDRIIQALPELLEPDGE